MRHELDEAPSVGGKRRRRACGASDDFEVHAERGAWGEGSNLPGGGTRDPDFGFSNTA